MQCCRKCFHHPWLQDYVLKNASARGRCPFCGSRNVRLTDLKYLSEPFQNLLNNYEPLQQGQTFYPWEDPLDAGGPIVLQINYDWNIFSDELVFDTKKADRLFDAIMKSAWDDDGPFPPIANDLYTSRKSIFHSTLEDNWQKFCSDVMESPGYEFGDFWEEDLQKAERKLRGGTILFRARTGFREDTKDKKAYERAEIGAPPKTEPGRANRNDKVVLYGADAEVTAVAEVRPCRGLLVSVARLRVKADLRIVDITVPLKSPNPFVRESVRYELEVLDVLRAFAEELGRPLERSDDLTSYLPCQKLSEFIERSRFHGIRYQSAMAPSGTNVVLFDPSQIKILCPSRLIRVTETSVNYEEYEGS